MTPTAEPLMLTPPPTAEALAIQARFEAQWRWYQDFTLRAVLAPPPTHFRGLCERR